MQTDPILYAITTACVVQTPKLMFLCNDTFIIGCPPPLLPLPYHTHWRLHVYFKIVVLYFLDFLVLTLVRDRTRNREMQCARKTVAPTPKLLTFLAASWWICHPPPKKKSATLLGRLGYQTFGPLVCYKRVEALSGYRSDTHSLIVTT